MNNFSVNTGIKLIPSSGLKPPYLIEYVELGASGPTGRAVKQRETFNAMPLKSGSYKVNYRQQEHGGSTITLVDSVEVPAGHLIEIEM